VRACVRACVYVITNTAQLPTFILLNTRTSKEKMY